MTYYLDTFLKPRLAKHNSLSKLLSQGWILMPTVCELSSTMDSSRDRRNISETFKFKESLILEIIKHHAADSKLRYSNEGAVAMNEVMIAFLQEIVWRAMNQASNEELTVVNLNHLEKILPQLLLDFA